MNIKNWFKEYRVCKYKEGYILQRNWQLGWATYHKDSYINHWWREIFNDVLVFESISEAEEFAEKLKGHYKKPEVVKYI